MRSSRQRRLVLALALCLAVSFFSPIRAHAAPILRRGSLGEDVSVLQGYLEQLGYYWAGVDGDFGPQTEAAVRAFQTAQGLVVDGIAGPITWEALGRVSPVSRSLQGPLRGLVIVLDAGHGGPDPGAVSVWGDKEKTFTLGMTLKTKRYLEEQGASVVLTRYGDYAPGSDWGFPVDELLARVSLANSHGADAFVSIHVNAYPKDTSISGTMGFYRKGSRASLDLARSIAWAVSDSCDLRMIDVQEGPYYVLNRTSMPAALIEVGFMTCWADVNRLRTEAFQDKAARGIAQGVAGYFGR